MYLGTNSSRHLTFWKITFTEIKAPQKEALCVGGWLALLPSSSRKVVYVHTPCIVGGGQGGEIQNMKNMDFVSTWTRLHVDYPPLLLKWLNNLCPNALRSWPNCPPCNRYFSSQGGKNRMFLTLDLVLPMRNIPRHNLAFGENEWSCERVHHYDQARVRGLDTGTDC